MARVKGEPVAGHPSTEKVPSTKFPRGFGYRVRVAVIDAQGKRRFPEPTFATLKEADDYRASVLTKANEGVYVGSSAMTVRNAVEAWLGIKRGATNTKGARAHALSPVIRVYGDRRVQSITTDDVNRLMHQLVDGTAPGCRKRSPGYVNVMRAKWQSCWKSLESQGVLPRGPNVVAVVEPLDRPEPDDDGAEDEDTYSIGAGGGRRLSDADIAALVAAHDPGAPMPHGTKGRAVQTYRNTRRRRVFLELALLGLRRGEIAGLRWSAVRGLDSAHPTLRVTRTRVVTGDGTEEKGRGKTRSAVRTLLLPPEVAAALRWHQALQAEDQKRMRRDDAPEYVVTKDGLSPVAPGTLTGWWKTSLEQAGVDSSFRLHDARHTAASRLLAAGVPLMDVATWLGHADGGLLALRVYGHTDPRDLGRAAAALARPQSAPRKPPADSPFPDAVAGHADS